MSDIILINDYIFWEGGRIKAIDYFFKALMEFYYASSLSFLHVLTTFSIYDPKSVLKQYNIYFL